MSGTEKLVTLKGGFVVSLSVLRLAWDLEHRGLHLRVEGDHLTVGPRDAIRPDDDLAIRAYKTELIALTKYCDAFVYQGLEA